MSLPSNLPSPPLPHPSHLFPSLPSPKLGYTIYSTLPPLSYPTIISPLLPFPRIPYPTYLPAFPRTPVIPCIPYPPLRSYPSPLIPSLPLDPYPNVSPTLPYPSGHFSPLPYYTHSSTTLPSHPLPYLPTLTPLSCLAFPTLRSTRMPSPVHYPTLPYPSGPV